ncbi:MAG: hypothetical protein LBU77_00610, partial [Clostridiales bacterium]|nr:hypothetical protein [Clostridiales bacterium]
NKEVQHGERHKVPFWQKTLLYTRMINSFFRAPKDMKKLETAFVDVQAYFKEHYSEHLSIRELLALFQEIEERVLNHWYVTLHNDLYAFVWTGILKRRLAGKGVDVTKYISGITSLESLKPLKLLLELSEKYGGDADILANAEVQAYLETYGDRSPCELKLEVMTYREAPTVLADQMRVYAADKAKLKDMIRNLQPQAAEKIGFAAKRAKMGIENREISRLNRSRIYGMVRRIFLRIGKILYREGRIDAPLDVFYLEMAELESPVDLKQKIAERKAAYAVYETLPAHTRLVFRGDTLIDEKTAKNWTGSFEGIGTSAGSITAEAVVLASPNEKVNVRGKIIVTKTTDPGWVFLLTMAGGIIAEKGSLLSHTAIVSREIGIPAVVAVDNATAVIKTGDIIKIDGDTGRVQIVRAR